MTRVSPRLMPFMAVAFAGFAVGGVMVSPSGGAALPSVAPLPQPATGYSAEALRVIDGDTLELRIAVFPGHDIISRIRLARIDAPELNTPCAGERRAGEAARRHLADLAMGQRLVVSDPKPDKYFGRVVASVATEEGDLSDRLVANGHAVPYRGGRRTPHC